MCSWVGLLDLGEHLAQLFFEPGMQHGVGSPEDAFGTQVARGRAKQGQQFGRASTFVLMRLHGGMALRLPRRSGLRDGLLTAIGKARGWVDDLLGDRVASFAEIAAREGKTERYIRLLASLAFTSPRIIAALIDGTAPADLTVAGLAKALPDS